LSDRPFSTNLQRLSFVREISGHYNTALYQTSAFGLIDSLQES